MRGIEITSVSPGGALAKDYRLIDVRSPNEFAEGHAPGALNLPLLDDAQRAAVGLAYREQGAQQARTVAMELVTPGLTGYLRSLKLAAADGRRLAIMCWRGGERSRNVVLLLGLIGVYAERVEGGYKAYRRLVIEGLNAWRPEVPVVTLYGFTGSGKTALLRKLREAGRDGPFRPAVVDLEGLALHRGSLLGGLNQPARRTQKDFESLLWQALNRVEGDYLVFEGEGNKIGHLLLPENIAHAVRNGIPVHVSAGVPQRAQTILAEYAPQSWSASEVEQFGQALSLIGRRLPASAQQRLNDRFLAGHYLEVVEELLVTYYDPLYQHSSVEGKEFALTLRRSGDEEIDAGRLAQDLPAVLGLACDRQECPRVDSPRFQDEVACSR